MAEKICALKGNAGGESGPKCKTGTFTGNPSSTTTVNLGFKPKYLTIYYEKDDGNTVPGLDIYIEDENFGSNYNAFHVGDSGTRQRYAVGSYTASNSIAAITNNGFVYNKAYDSHYVTMHYYAIG